ncbi:MAG: hypothetical protein R3F62_03985 [Planctomycetota bacterium]
MEIDPTRYHQIRENPFQVAAGCVLEPLGEGTMDFMHRQGGDEATFILMLGAQRMHLGKGRPIEILEGIFLNEDGPGFHATWDHDQLMGEIRRGSWTIVPTETVLAEWTERVEARMNMTR